MSTWSSSLAIDAAAETLQIGREGESLVTQRAYESLPIAREHHLPNRPMALAAPVAECYTDDMASTSPARIDDDLYASAKLAGSVQSRSASQQVAHWARIGREIEASGTIGVREVHEVLAGSRSYDQLSATQQAEVRAEWSERMDARRDALDLVDRFTAEGRTWVELDDEGNVVHCGEGA